MCLIIVALQSKPDDTVIEKAYLDNSDGAGITWFENGKAKYQKGLYLEEIKSLVNETPLPFTVHFRGSSVGGKSILLTHPFEITEKSELHLSGESDRLLIHNGTYRDYEILMDLIGAEIPNDGKNLMSDSRAISLILSKLDIQKQSEFLIKLSKLGTNGKNSITGQKFVLACGESNNFIRFGDFYERNGNFYSTFSWESQQIYKPRQIHYPISSHISSYGVPFDINRKKNISTGLISAVLTWIRDKEDKKKYYKYLKCQDILNGASVVKQEDDTNDIVSCRFCYREVSAARVNTLKLIGYNDYEMACFDCSHELNYYKSSLDNHAFNS